MRHSIKSSPSVLANLVLTAVIALTAGCDGKSSSDRERAERTIVLQCSGHRMNSTDSTQESASYLIKIDPFNQFQESLHYFSSDEKMFVSPCESKLTECNVSVSPDIIVEHGAMRLSDNQIAWTETTEINRRTGSMKIVKIEQILGISTLFEGTCKKSELPADQAQKF